LVHVRSIKKDMPFPRKQAFFENIISLSGVHETNTQKVSDWEYVGVGESLNKQVWQGEKSAGRNSEGEKFPPQLFAIYLTVPIMRSSLLRQDLSQELSIELQTRIVVVGHIGTIGLLVHTKCI